MTPRAWFGAAAVAALTWLSSAELPFPARFWTTALLAGLPVLMIVQARQLDAAGPLPRVPTYVSSILSLWMLAALTAATAFFAGYTAESLGLGAVEPRLLLGWTAALSVISVAVVLLFHVLGFRESAITRQLIPETRGERAWFVGVSVTAGVCEEFVFRGFLILALHTATGSLLLAVLLSSTVFGIVHAYQQPVGALRAGLLGAVLAVPLVLHSTLWPGIIAHALVDLVAGLFLARYLIR